MAAEIVVAVTGVSGFLGQRLLPLLDASPHVDRIVGLDIRDPARRARKLEFHRADVLGTDLTPYFRDVSSIVHLA
jgi:nucleoside-diphosphate-sugar epimerase